MSACISALKPNTEASGPSAAITAPPGTPGAATMQIASTKMKLRKSGRLQGKPLIRQMVSAQQVIFIIEPERWMVAQSGNGKAGNAVGYAVFQSLLQCYRNGGCRRRGAESREVGWQHIEQQLKRILVGQAACQQILIK